MNQLILFFFNVLGFRLRASHLLGTLPLEPVHQPIFFYVFGVFEIGCRLLPGLSWNCNPPDLYFLSS
jgi:hypothetical protein